MVNKIFIHLHPKTLLTVCAGILGGLLAHGYSYGIGDEIFLLPYMQSFQGHWWDLDVTVQSFKHFFPSVFLYFASYVPVSAYPLLLVALHGLTYLSVAVLLYLIIYTVWKDKTAALIGVAAAIWTPNLLLINGADTFVGNTVDHTTIVVPFLLLSVLLYVRRKYIGSGMAVGGAALIHPLFSGFLAFSIAVYLFYKKEWRSCWSFVLSYAPWFCVAAGYALLHLSVSVDVADRSQLWMFLKAYGGGLALWLNTNPYSICEFFLFLLTIVLAWFLLLRHDPRLSEKKAMLAPLFLGAAVFMLCTLILGDALHISTIAFFKLLRSGFFVTFGGLIILAGLAAILLKNESVVSKLGALTIVAFLFSWKFIMLVPVCIFLGLYLLFWKKEQEHTIIWLFMIAISAWGVLLSVLYSSLPSEYSSKTWVFLPVLVVNAFVVGISLQVPFVVKVARWGMIGSMAVIICMPVVYGAYVSAASSGNIFIRTYDSAWEDIQRKAEALIPAGEVVLTPPYIEGFRVFSHRTPYLETTDWGAADYNQSYVSYFYTKLEAFGYKGVMPFNIAQAWDSLFPDGAASFADAHRIHFLVLEKKSSVGIGWKLLYANNSYSLYARLAQKP